MAGERAPRRWLLGLILAALLGGLGVFAFRNVGRWLVVQDPLQHARAIVVLSGLLPFRAMQAAEIYKQGWAPEVWLFRDEDREADQAFARLGVHHTTEEEYDREILEHLGVPEASIRTLLPAASNTESEFEVVGGELRRDGGDAVILVTSPMHTRRSRLIWRKVVGDHPRAILRYDTSEPTDPDHWWQSTQDVQMVEHELLGLVDAYAGFVVKPRHQR